MTTTSTTPAQALVAMPDSCDSNTQHRLTWAVATLLSNAASLSATATVESQVNSLFGVDSEVAKEVARVLQEVAH